MLDHVANIRRIQKLYLQMLYRCNFNCKHCFQGENLKRSERFTISDALRAICLFRDKYELKSVTLLGGEPFIHPEIGDVLVYCKSLGLQTMVCTNGYRVGQLLKKVSNHVDHLRVSIDGVGDTHDTIRRSGSYSAALTTLETARNCGVEASVTMTVMSPNVKEVYALAREVSLRGVKQLKLHQLRLVGNAVRYPELLCTDSELALLRSQISLIHSELAVEVLLDEDLDINHCIVPDGKAPETFELERVEIQPDGAMYISCKAVGDGSNAFWFNKEGGTIQYRPTPTDELVAGTPQVRYARV